MDKKDRNTLKSYFQRGKVPTEEQFAELIDSVPNTKEDGQAVCTGKGWAFYPQKGGLMRIAIHEEEGEDTASWTLAVTPDKGLAMENRNGESLLELRQDKTIVLHADIRKEGGEEPGPQDYREIKTDKQWADLVEVTDEKDCSRVYTIIALYHDVNLGVCKLTYATAICLNSLEQWVESPRKHWWGWSGRLHLRWQSKGGKACLQIRSTRNSYSGKIYCRVTETFKK